MSKSSDQLLTRLRIIGGILVICIVLFSVLKMFVLLPVNIEAVAAGLTKQEIKHDEDMEETVSQHELELTLAPIIQKIGFVHDNAYDAKIAAEKANEGIKEILKVMAMDGRSGAHTN